MKRSFLSALLFCFILTSLTLVSVSLSAFSLKRVIAQESITAPLATVDVTVDGVMSPGEWDDAQVIVLGDSLWYGYIYFKHNNTFLWLLLDYVNDTDQHPMGWDNGWCAIDINGDGGTAPKEDDLLFHTGGHCYIGDGPYQITDSQWALLLGQIETLPDNQANLFALIEDTFDYKGGWGTSEASATPHVLSELAIPLSILEGKTSCGIWAAMQDNSHPPEYPTNHLLEFPEELGTDPSWWPGPDYPEENIPAPNDWGTLTLGAESLTEKPILPEPPAGTTPPPPSLALEDVWLYIVIAVGAGILVLVVVTSYVTREK